MRSCLAAIILLAGCSAILPPDTVADHATLTFENHRLCCGFECVDGQALRTGHTTLLVKPGERSIRYFCALILDGPPSPKITMNFRAGKTYVFKCTGGDAATIEER